ncbi:hypothetical protein [Paraglaciecola sp.]|uniref:hypothetical protein n=1 Tax=Paraglaciecola sp. TaxID=1920173 RepID=UPI003EF3B8DC
MSKLIFSFALCVMFATPVFSSSLDAEKIRIGYIDLPEVLDRSGKSAPYNELMARLLNRIAMPYSTLFIPSARSNYLIHQKRIDCVFPVIPGFYKRAVPTLFSEATNKVTSHLFSVTTPAIQSLEASSGKMIAYRKGLIFGTLFDKFQFVRFVPVETEDIAIKLLHSNKVDGYIAYYPDITLSLNAETLSLLKFNKDKPLTSSEDKLECVDTPINRVFIEKFNHQLQKMKTSGELKHILNKYYNL